MQFLRALSNNAHPSSLANKLRKKRFELFRALLLEVPKPIRILDLGGTQNFWKQMGYADEKKIQITLLNLTSEETDSPSFISIAGNACDLSQFQDKEFDIVFSNSVIEHVGDKNAQQQMAEEVCRVGQRYFIQTPNFSFPIEPHFLFPGFQFLPFELQTWLVRHFKLGWTERAVSEEAAKALVQSVKLLSKRDLRKLFPKAKIFNEKFLGFTKSFVAYEGFEQIEQSEDRQSEGKQLFRHQKPCKSE